MPLPTIRNGNTMDCCICSFTCGTCLNLQYFTTTSGMIKILQLVLGSLCQSLLLNFGLKYASLIGFSYDAFLSTVSACLMTTTILLICYAVSQKSMSLIRSSLFEIVFNIMACLGFVTSSSFLFLAVSMFLYPFFLITPFYVVYPAMIAVYVLGFVLCIIYGFDAYMAYKYYLGYR